MTKKFWIGFGLGFGIAWLFSASRKAPGPYSGLGYYGRSLHPDHPNHPYRNGPAVWGGRQIRY